MSTSAGPRQFAPVPVGPLRGVLLALALASANAPRAFRLSRPNEVLPDNFFAPRPRTAATVSIFAVDDEPDITKLYAILLEPQGFEVRVFNDRRQALAALRADRKPPSLLNTDYMGVSVPVDEFVRTCRLIHPGLRILMITGLDPSSLRLARIRPDRLLQKPFTTEQLEQEVKAALSA